MPGEKSLWDIAIAQSKAADEEKPSEEAAVLLVGSKNAGKTSIILRFLDRDEAPKPTVALEYTFGRRAKGHNLAKDVGHIWELGGGTWLSKLIDVPIHQNSLSTMAVMLVVDLSTPNELWFTIEKWLAVLKAHVQSVIKEAQLDDPKVKDKLRTKAWERVGVDHPDKDLIEPFTLPFVIIGSKYDIFQDFDSEKRKVICKTLRFIAHTNGAHLQFFTTKQDALLNRARALVSHLLFATSGSKTVQADHNKPILVPWGMDTLQNIGSPPLPDGDLGKVVAKNPMELWKTAYTTHFPQEKLSDPALVEDPAKDVQYVEPAVDAMRKQKDEELERYKKLSEKRSKEASQRSIADFIN